MFQQVGFSGETAVKLQCMGSLSKESGAARCGEKQCCRSVLLEIKHTHTLPETNSKSPTCFLFARQKGNFIGTQAP